MKSLKHHLLVGAASIVGTITFVQPAEAQTSAREEGSEASTWQGDIIVTARRREETAQESPVAMTVLNETLLDRYAVDGVDSIASLTPGLVTGESAGAVGGSISLRGVGSGEAQAFIDQAVSINIDGVPISTAQLLRVGQMDLKQIEVLRGPQALFFGKNSPGGIISLTTADPGDELEVMARAGYEFNAKEMFVDATLSTPLTDTIGLRLAGHYADMDGYINVESPVELLPATAIGIRRATLDAFPRQRDLFLRGTLKFEPSDRFDLTIKGTIANTRIDGATSYFSDITYCPYGTAQDVYRVPNNCKNDGMIIAAQIPDSVLALNPQLKPMGNRNSKQTMLSATMNYDLSDLLKITSVTGYYNAKEDISSHGGYGMAPTNIWAANYQNKQVTQELRLASDLSGPANFVIGGFFEDRELYTDTYIVVPTFGSCPACYELPYEVTRQKQKSYSAFGQLMLDVTDKVQIAAGGRYTHEIKNVKEYLIAVDGFLSPARVLDAPLVNVLNPATYTRPTRITFNNFSPEATITFKPNDDVMFFASYKRGFKSGGFDGSYTAGGVLTKGVNSFKPEKVQGGEIGVKSSLADRQLIFNVTGYWYDYDDLQVTTYDTAARAFGTGNAAKARVRGVEIETRFAPRSVPGLDLHAAANFNDAKFRKFFAQCYKSQSQALGCNHDINPVTGIANTQDLSGVQLRKAPKFTATVGGYYETPVSSGLMISLSSDMSYSGGYNYGTDYQPYTYQKKFAKLDASLRVFAENKRWELALIGRNLTDKLNLVNGIDRTGTGGAFGTTAPVCASLPATGGCLPAADLIGTPTHPRSVTLQATFRY